MQSDSGPFVAAQETIRFASGETRLDEPGFAAGCNK
jgi:hypothetical protein